MTDPTLDPALAARLVAYAERGLRPVDPYAIAEATIAARRWTLAGRWRVGPIGSTLDDRLLRLVLIAGLLLALASAAALAAGLLRPAPSAPGYEAILLRASEGTPPRSVEVIAVSPDGQERFVRRIDASDLPDGRTLTASGAVSRDGWLAIHTGPVSRPAQAAWALFDLSDDTRAPTIVRYTSFIGGAWGAGGRFATLAPGRPSGFDVQVVDAPSGRTTELGQLALPGSGPDLIWAADGSGLLVRPVVDADGYGVEPVDGGTVGPGVPALTWRVGSRYLAEGGAELTRTETTVTVKDPVSGSTTWYSGEPARETVMDASFSADGRSVWLLLDRRDGDPHDAVIARAEAPGNVTILGTVDLGPEAVSSLIGGIAPDDSSLVIRSWTVRLRAGSRQRSGDMIEAPPVVVELPGAGSIDPSGPYVGTFIGYAYPAAFQTR